MLSPSLSCPTPRNTGWVTWVQGHPTNTVLRWQQITDSQGGSITSPLQKLQTNCEVFEENRHPLASICFPSGIYFRFVFIIVVCMTRVSGCMSVTAHAEVRWWFWSLLAFHLYKAFQVARLAQQVPPPRLSPLAGPIGLPFFLLFFLPLMVFLDRVSL